MPAIEIDFEWYRDEHGYDLLPEMVDKSVSPPSVSLMKLFGDEVGGKWFPCRVARRGGRLVPYYPLAKFDTLYIQLSGALTPQHVYDFVDRFGPLSQKGLEEGGFDDVEVVLSHAAGMRRLIEGKHDRETINAVNSLRRHPLHHIDFKLVFDPATKSPRLHYVPRSLLTGLWLQLCQAISEGVALKKCQHCSALFPAGANGRRSDAKFCCAEHQERHKSLRRSRRPSDPGLAAG